MKLTLIYILFKIFLCKIYVAVKISIELIHSSGPNIVFVKNDQYCYLHNLGQYY
jgi:hypothetical protein